MELIKINHIHSGGFIYHSSRSSRTGNYNLEDFSFEIDTPTLKPQNVLEAFRSLYSKSFLHYTLDVSVGLLNLHELLIFIF